MRGGAVDGAQHGAERRVLVAKRIALRIGLLRFPARRGDVPERVLERGLLRGEQRRDEERAEQASYARHCSSPAMNRSFGSFLPMKTSVEDFFSPFAQGLPMSPPIIMCTPWNTTRFALPFIHSTPL